MLLQLHGIVMIEQQMHSNEMFATILSISFHCLHGCDCVSILTMRLMKSLDQGTDFQGISWFVEVVRGEALTRV